MRRRCKLWCVQLREDEVLRLEAATRPAGVPLLIARSYGLAGYLRVRFPWTVAIRCERGGSVHACRSRMILRSFEASKW